MAVQGINTSPYTSMQAAHTLGKGILEGAAEQGMDRVVTQYLSYLLASTAE